MIKKLIGLIILTGLIYSPLGTTAAEAANIVLNPGFESGTSSWSWWSANGGSFVTSSPGYTGTYAAKCAVAQPSGNIQLYQYNIALDPNTTYRFTFSAYSPTGRDIAVSLFNHSTGANYGLSNYTADLGTTWQTFTKEFTTTGFSSKVTNGRLMLWLASSAQAGTVYYIDDVKIEKAGANTAPVLASIGNKTVNEGSLLQFTVSAIDAEGNALTYSATNLPAGAVFTPATRTFSWTPGNTQSGSYPNVHFEVTDGSLTDFEDITITVNDVPVNTAPAANNQSKSTNMNTSVPITLTATDADNDPLTYTVVSNPAHGALTGTAPNLTYTPTTGYSGADSFTFKASDGRVDSNTAIVSITVNAAANTAPVLASIGNKTVNEGSLLQFTVSAADAEGNTLTYSATGLPAGATFTPSTRTFSWTPGNTQSGSYPNVHFQVTDTGSLTDFEDITITVNDVPQSAGLKAYWSFNEGTGATSTTDSTTNGNTGNLLPVASRPVWTTTSISGGQALSFSAGNYVEAPASNSINIAGNTITLSAWVYTTSFADHQTVIAKPANATSHTSPYFSYAISILNDHRIQFYVDTAAGAKVAFSSYTAMSLNAWHHVVGVYNGTNMVVYVDKVAGTPTASTANIVSFNTPVRIGVNGGYTERMTGIVDEVRIYNSALTLAEITAIYDAGTSSNTVPVLASIGNKTVNEGSLLQFTVSAIDAEGNALTYSATNLPAGAVFTPATRTFSWTPGNTQSGSYPNVHFEVTDGSLTDFEDITITVNDVPVNTAPAANNQSKSTNMNTSVPITLTATDADNDPLTYTVVSNPAHGALTGTAPNLTYTPTTGYSGADSFTFKASDGRVDSNTAIVSITVNAAANTAPVLASIGNKTVNEGSLLQFTVSAADAEGNTLTYSATGLPAGATFTPSTRTFSWTPGNTQSGSYPNVHFQVTDTGSLTDSEDITITVSDVIGSVNIVANPGFELGVTSWNWWSASGGSFVTSSPGYTGTYAAKCAVAQPSGNIQLYQYNIALDPNTTYRFTFSAYSPTGRDIAVSLFNHSTGANYGLSNYTADLGTTWQTFTKEFTTTGFSSKVTNGRLMLWLASSAQAGTVYYIDDVKIEKPTPNTAPAAPTASPSGPAAGNTGTSYAYTTSAIDPDSDQVKYTFEWGDTTTGETGLVNSGVSAGLSHTWAAAGTYLVKAKTTDSKGAVSAFGPALSVVISGVNNTITNGSYPIRLMVVDNAGNLTGTTLNVTVNNEDATSPIIAFTSPAPNGETAGVITLNGSIAEPYLSSYIAEYSSKEQPDTWIQIGGSHKVMDLPGILASFSPLLLAKGNYTIRITATDTSDNSSTQALTINTGHKLNSAGGHLYAANTLSDDRRLEFAYKSFDFKPNNLILDQPSAIKLHYTDQELTDCGYEENLLSIFLYDEAALSWRPIPTRIDYDSNILIADITELGVYCVKEYKPGLADTTLPVAEITASAYNSSIGIVTITGTANDENLDSYIVEYSQTDNPDNWIRVENSPKIITESTLVSFDAKDLFAGNYSARLTVYDQAGNTSQAASRFIIGEDKIIDLFASSGYIAPEVSSNDVPRTLTITYQVLQDANITVKIKDQATGIITLLDNQPQTKGVQTLIWDGKDLNSQFVPAKTYTIEVTSSAGTQATIPIEVKDLIAKISVPYEDSLVKGWVPVFGLACGKDFKQYILEYGEGKEPAAWMPIITSSSPQSVDVVPDRLISGDTTIFGNLATWETGLSNYIYGKWSVDLSGTYTLRLTTANNSGRQEINTVTVEVARVIPNIYGGTAISPDGKIILTVPEQALPDDFEVISISAIDNTTVTINSGYRLVGHIYEVEPPGEKFTKDVTLEMSYADTDLGGLDETKLAIYAYNPLTFNWDYLTTNQDLINNRLTAVLREITEGYAYYAILAKTSAPSKPVLYNLSSASTQLRYVTVSGMAGRGERVEIFVNGASRGTAKADMNTGFFSLANVLLDAGVNSIIVISTDQFGQISVSSDSITVTQGETPPQTVTSVSFKDSGYLADFPGPVYLEGALYIEATGADANPNSLDATSVTLKSSVTAPAGIALQLLETNYNSGVYRGVAYLDLLTDATKRKLAAQSNGETITVTSLIDNTKSDSLIVVDNVAPEVPAITSSTHPSVCQNTFEDGLDQWSNRDGEVGATLYLDDTQTLDYTNCLKLVNIEYGGNFASNVRTAQFDASQYSIVNFDYKIPDSVKINFMVKLKDDPNWYDIILTDDAKNYWRMNMEQIGIIEGVIKDDTWQHASFDLYEMLKTKTGNFQVESIIMADWDTAGYMKLVYGANSAYAAYYLDNFTITKRGFTNKNPQFTITVANDPSGIDGYSYVLDQIQNTIPDETIDGTGSLVSYTDIADGAWYFHVRTKDKAGNWSGTNQYRIIIDTIGPAADSLSPQAFSSSGSPVITLRLTDNQGTGVDPETIRFKVKGNEYDIHSPALTYDKQTETLIFTPLKLGMIWPDKQAIDAELIQVRDYLGNAMQNSLKWQWMLEYSLDATAPDAPKIISPPTHNLTYSKATFMWEAQDANGISDYSFMLDQNPDTIPDDIGEGLVTSKIYDLVPGTYYFHVKAKDRPGNWSLATHFPMTIGQPASMLINDFNDGQDPNEVGGYSGVWESGNATCQVSYYNTDLNNVYGQEGCSLRISYDVTKAGSYSGYWAATYIDLSDYKALTFWIKGAAGGENLRVGLKDSSYNESKVLIEDYLSSGVTASWQKVVIPLSAFRQVSNRTAMDSISFSFYNNLGNPTSGAVYVDEVRFEKTIDPIIVSTFNGATNQNALGGNFETFTWDIATISCGYDSNSSYNNSSYGYNITYSGVVPFVSYAVWKAHFNKLDVSIFNSLSFYIKGSIGGEKPNIYFVSNDNSIRKFVDIERYVNITANWQRVNIPLLDFIKQGVDLSSLNELQVSFEWEQMSGTIYLDDIQFTNIDFGEAPIVNIISAVTNQGNIAITGRGIPGQTIIPVVEIPYVGRWQQTPVVVNPDGTFTAIINIYNQGHQQIYVYAIDENGNISLVSAVQTTFLDQVAPAVPTLGSIDSPRREPDITVTGLAESGSTVYIKVIQPRSGLIEYAQEALNGYYSKDITLSDGDGTYLMSVVSKDDAGNQSTESTPLQVVLDAVNQKPTVSITSPNGKEILSQDNYFIIWQASDPDPLDVLNVDIQYTNSLNQILVDNFDDGDWLNSLNAWSGQDEGSAIEAIFNNYPALAYGNTGKSLQLNYNVTSQNSHAGFSTGLYTKPNMSAYGYISLLVKGVVGGELFEVGLKDSTMNETRLLVTSYLPNGVTADWQRVAIPLADFTNIDLSSMDSFSIGFGNLIGSGQGTIYLDEIRFIKWQDIALNQANNGSYGWNTAILPASDRYLLKLTAKDTRGLEAKDVSDDYFCLASNLAKDKTASASSQEGQDVAVSNALDGNMGTRWSSQFSDPQWIKIDLSRKQNINRVILKWETAYGKSYQIQTSDDGINWMTVYSTTTGDGGIDDISFTGTSCRYVRIYGAERGTIWGYSLWEFEVYHTTTPFYNAVASSEQGPDVLPIYAIDGNSSTGWSSNSMDNEWIYVDFGAPSTFNAVILNWGASFGRQYEIQTSDDALIWDTIYTETNSDGGVDMLDVSARTARYLKMKGVQRGTELGYSLREIGIQ